jgi:polysaccharide lyase-like protein
MATPLQIAKFARRAALVLSLVLALGLALVSASAAEAKSCGRIHVGVSKRVVTPGQALRVTGSTCGAADQRPHFVRIKLRTKNGWRQVGVSHTHANGRFSRQVRIKVPQSKRKTRLKVVASAAKSPSVPLTVTAPTPAPAPSICPLANPNAEIGATVSGCHLLASDTAANPNPLSFWGRADCGVWPNLEQTRPTNPTTGGDTHLTATGTPQGNDAYRSVTVFDGDDVAGERCELGENDNEVGPTAFYHEGQRRATYISLRLPDNFPLDAQAWQTILQMKQAQPANNGGGVPILFMGAYENTFVVDSDHGVHWTFPAQKNVWTRFMFDVTYSQDPNVGSLQVAADLNDDGDFEDAGERSPRIHTQTLRVETPGPQTSVPVGASIPDHLRAGIYHNPSIPCPRPVGCSTEIDNVQVLAP